MLWARSVGPRGARRGAVEHRRGRRGGFVSGVLTYLGLYDQGEVNVFGLVYGVGDRF